MQKYLVTWFYSEQVCDESYYPSVGMKSSSERFKSVYWKCVYNLYQSALLSHEIATIKYLFFTNVKTLPIIDGVDFENFFRQNKIQVIYLELSKKTTKDWYGAWRNQFYLFDMLQYLKDYKGAFLILDSDCIVVKNLMEVFQNIEQKKKYFLSNRVWTRTYD